MIMIVRETETEAGWTLRLIDEVPVKVEVSIKYQHESDKDDL
jgi:hypothetical protein